MSLGERITDIRNEQKLSQGQLASLLNVSRQAISKWENDESSPDTLHLIQLADALNTEVEYLATGKKPVYEEAPIVVNLVKTEDRIVEKIVEKPIIKKVIHRKVSYIRNPLEFLAVGFLGFFLGLLVGILI